MNEEVCMQHVLALANTSKKIAQSQTASTSVTPSYKCQLFVSVEISQLLLWT